MIIDTEQNMMSFGEKIAETLSSPVTIELIGDVGVGKTTLVKGIAKGFGITETVNSPSFTLSKEYNSALMGVTLRHYDFYRLEDAGIMEDELRESVDDEKVITIVEWGKSVEDVLPKCRMKIMLKYLEDGKRDVEIIR
ncbi:MAG: tRNA (adenosine(37)-N6)-threonylcarbamoyltransferase complex ATPase subunit type 1 TsaE [Candidatus Nomurabacteria bacterium]|jgi:tRNA threonylcarbamoyladenosine biosynthesis protein TsaE|nr:tRNA (adenosine(37)-N6)-threonylcarbamoyltransferase complex ATPase subunit type 1 TsaE [Candidatus Nomurabacteria bacterium]